MTAFFQKQPDDAGPEFRSRCLERLQSALAGEGGELENLEKVRAESTPEHYYRAGLRGTDLMVYIYDDGAEVLGPHTDRRFEWQAFDSLDELCEEFVQTAVELCG